MLDLFYTMENESSDPSLTVEEAMHIDFDLPFEEVVPIVQIEHEIVGFETIKVSRLDEMIKGFLEEDVSKTALIVVCHAEIARDALNIDPKLAGLLPCTTIIYETQEDDLVHVYHVSVTKAIKELGFVPNNKESLEELIDLTGEKMEKVWKNLKSHDSSYY